jgi:hypothetical protein
MGGEAMLHKVAYAALIVIIAALVASNSVIYDNLVHAWSELSQLRTETASLEMSLEETEQRLARTEEDLISANLTIDSLESRLQLYKDTWTVFDRDLHPDAYSGWEGGALVDNATASDSTWAELLDFLLEDRTDENPYVPGVYECGNFAKDVHNNAESAGIRAGYVRLYFRDTAHSINAFQTTDEGLVFVDCTGKREPEPGRSYDRVVALKLWDDYAYRYLLPVSSEDEVTKDWGPVLDLIIHW